MEIEKEIVSAVKGAKKIVVLTGAGISAESGIPTFREPLTGVWAQYNPEEIASPGAFRRDPQLSWKFHADGREMCKKAKPNAAHVSLAEMDLKVPTTIVTQNVDMLHQRAGSLDVIEIHGNIFRVRCPEDERHVKKEWMDASSELQYCPVCDAPLRPDVVWFGEFLPVKEFNRAAKAVMECDVLMTVGTSTLVHPAAGLPWRAKEKGAIVIEINPNPTPLSDDADFVIRGPAGKVLPALVLKCWGEI